MDNTQLSKFLTCHEAYRLAYGPKEHGLQLCKRREDESRPLHMPWGAVAHSGLESYYLGKDKQLIHKAVKDAYAKEIGDQPQGEELYTLRNAEALMEQYPAWAMKNDGEQTVLATEIYGEIKLGEGYKPFECIIDTVVKRASGIWSLEHKTTSKALNYIYWQQFEPSTQISAQAAYIEQEFGQCSGVTINALSIGNLKKPKLLDPDDPEVKEYSEVNVSYSKYYKAEKAYCSGFHWQGGRQIFNRTPQQIEDFKRNARRVYDRLGETIDRYGWADVWEKNESACYWCEYKDICNSCASPEIIELMYEQYDAYEYINNRREESRTEGAIDGN